MDPKNPYQTPAADVTPQYEAGTDQSSPFSPSGRFGRLSFIAWVALIGVVYNLIGAMVGGTEMFMPRYDASGTPVPPEIGVVPLIVLAVLGLIFFVFYVIFAIRRCHDFNASGWWNLLLVLPLVNLVFMLFLWLKPGDAGANVHGPPRETPGWEKVVGIIGVVLIVGGLVLTIGSTITAVMLASSGGAAS
jgi:uncharacterized membrane protein YhaH (DUF805 family)